MASLRCIVVIVLLYIQGEFSNAASIDRSKRQASVSSEGVSVTHTGRSGQDDYSFGGHVNFEPKSAGVHASVTRNFDNGGYLGGSEYVSVGRDGASSGVGIHGGYTSPSGFRVGGEIRRDSNPYGSSTSGTAEIGYENDGGTKVSAYGQRDFQSGHTSAGLNVHIPFGRKKRDLEAEDEEEEEEEDHESLERRKRQTSVDARVSGTGRRDYSVGVDVSRRHGNHDYSLGGTYQRSGPYRGTEVRGGYGYTNRHGVRFGVQGYHSRNNFGGRDTGVRAGVSIPFGRKKRDLEAEDTEEEEEVSKILERRKRQTSVDARVSGTGRRDYSVGVDVNRRSGNHDYSLGGTYQRSGPYRGTELRGGYGYTNRHGVRFGVQGYHNRNNFGGRDTGVRAGISIPFGRKKRDLKAEDTEEEEEDDESLERRKRQTSVDARVSGTGRRDYSVGVDLNRRQGNHDYSLGGTYQRSGPYRGTEVRGGYGYTNRHGVRFGVQGYHNRNNFGGRDTGVRAGISIPFGK